MTKEEFDRKYVGEKTVVKYKTFEAFNSFLKLADKFGYTRRGSKKYINTSWDRDLCFLIRRGIFADISYFTQRNYTIVEYSEVESKFIPIVNNIHYMCEGEFVTNGVNIYEIDKEGLIDSNGHVDAEATLDFLLGRGNFKKFPGDVVVVNTNTGCTITMPLVDWLELEKQYSNSTS